jgi:hypothetical protein
VGRAGSPPLPTAAAPTQTRQQPQAALQRGLRPPPRAAGRSEAPGGRPAPSTGSWAHSRPSGQSLGSRVHDFDTNPIGYRKRGAETCCFRPFSRRAAARSGRRQPAAITTHHRSVAAYRAKRGTRPSPGRDRCPPLGAALACSHHMPPSREMRFCFDLFAMLNCQTAKTT